MFFYNGFVETSRSCERNVKLAEELDLNLGVFVHRDRMNWQTKAYTVYRCRLISEVKHERRVTCKTVLPLHPPAPESIPSEEIRA